jgi:hypothetical protein
VKNGVEFLDCAQFSPCSRRYRCIMVSLFLDCVGDMVSIFLDYTGSIRKYGVNIFGLRREYGVDIFGFA